MATVSQFTNSNIDAVSVTIADGETVSDAVICNGLLLQSIEFPSNFDGTTLTFQASVDNGASFQPIHASGGSALSATVAASRNAVVEAFGIKGYDQIKLVAGTSQTDDSILKVKFVGE